LEKTTKLNISKSSQSRKLKNPLLIVGGIFFLLIAIIGGYIIWFNNFATIATINGQAITRQVFNNKKTYNKKIYEYTEDKKSLTQLSAVTERKLIEDTVIQTEAEKRNIVISDEAIDREYKKILSNYKDEAEYIKTTNEIVGEGNSKTKENIRLRLEKEELEKQVVKYYNLGQLYYRTDFKTLDGSADDTARIQKGKAKIDGIEAELQAGSTWKDITAEVLKDTDFPIPFSGAIYRGKVTSEEAKTLHLNTQEWSEITKLKKIGDFTPVVTADGGFNSIYYAEFVSSGTYSSWEKYIDSFINDSTGTVACGTEQNLAQRLISMLIPNAYAACADTSSLMDSSHLARLYGITQATLDGAIWSISLDTLKVTPVNFNNGTLWCDNAGLDPAEVIEVGGWYVDFLFCGYQWKVVPTKYGYNYSSNSTTDYTNGAPVGGNYQGNRDLNYFPVVNGGYYHVNMMFTPKPKQSITLTKAGNGKGTVTSSSSGSESVPAPNLAVRSYYFSNGYHFLTQNVNEVPGISGGTNGFEGIAFYADSTQVAGSVPVYRFIKGPDHYYSLSSTPPAGYTNESGAAWYGYSAQVAGTVGVYQYHHTSTNDHLYTTTYSPSGIAGVYAYDGPAVYVSNGVSLGSTSVAVAEQSLDGIISCGTACNTTSGNFTQNYNVVLTATADATTGSSFSSWSGCTSTSGATCYATMSGAKNVTVTFTAPTYTITSTADTGCTISPTPSAVVSYNGSITFTGSASAGYNFSGFSKDGVATQASGTFTNVTAGHAIAAKCSANPPPTCTLSGGSTIYRGSSQILSWSTTNATSVSATSPSLWASSTATTGSKSVSPTTTTTYSMTATGPGGTVSCPNQTVLVQYCGDGAKNAAEICDLGASNTDACGTGCTTSCKARTTCCIPLADETKDGTCPLGQTGTVTLERHSICPGPTWDIWHEKAGTSTCKNACSVSISVVPDTGFASDTPVVETIVTQGNNKATLTFDGTGSITVPDGSTNTPHQFTTIPGVHTATVTCTGDDGVKHIASDNYILKDQVKPCDSLCDNINKSIVNNTAKPVGAGGYEYETKVNEGADDTEVKINLTADTSSADSALWNYLKRLGIDVDDVNTDPLVKELVKVISTPVDYTSWFDPIGGTATPKPLTFKKYGKYELNLVGTNPEKLDNTRYVMCKTCLIPINIRRPNCSVPDGIITEPTKPAATMLTNPPNPDGSFIASNIKPLPITFSATQTGVGPEGIQSWELWREDPSPCVDKKDGYCRIDFVGDALANTELTTQFVQKFTGEDGYITASGFNIIREDLSDTPTYGPGSYRVLYKASSMQDGYGAYDPDGGCDKTFDFKVMRGAEIKCVISPAKQGVAPQPVQLDVEGDKRYYQNSFKTIINSRDPSLFTLSPGPAGFGLYSGIVPSFLKSAGRYYIAVEGLRTTVDPDIPNVAPCEDPSDSTLRFCGAGLCNYTVTNPGGGGGTEVAP